MNIDDKKRIEELEKELEGKPVCISWDGFIDRKGAAYQDKDDSWSFEFYKGKTTMRIGTLGDGCSFEEAILKIEENFGLHIVAK